MAAAPAAAQNSDSVKPFPYQVAGHLVQDGFKLTVDGCVLKPVQKPPKGEREVLFYETVFNEEEERDEILQLRRLLPHYYGVVELDKIRYLKLENITDKFNVPCVMDIKIGRVTWEDDMDQKFRERRRMKWPLKEITGFSILGYMVYNHSRSCYERYNREYCMKLATVEDAEKAFQQFLGCTKVELTRSILEQLIKQLMEIKRWFTIQRLYRFIASSILIVYEGDTEKTSSGTLQQALEQNDTRSDLNIIHLPALKNCHRQSPLKKTLVETRMIDTAHVFTSSDLDNNYLFGLENVISIVEKCRRIYTN
ncbi:hypothetical protein ACROYT_G030454 [Oculina patagonica]